MLFLVVGSNEKYTLTQQYKSKIDAQKWGKEWR